MVVQLTVFIWLSN